MGAFKAIPFLSYFDNRISALSYVRLEVGVLAVADNDVFTRAKVKYVDVETITSRKGDVYTLIALKAEGVGLIKCFVPAEVVLPDDLVIGDDLVASFSLRTDARLSLGLALIALERDHSAVV